MSIFMSHVITTLLLFSLSLSLTFFFLLLVDSISLTVRHLVDTVSYDITIHFFYDIYTYLSINSIRHHIFPFTSGYRHS